MSVNQPITSAATRAIWEFLRQHPGEQFTAVEISRILALSANSGQAWSSLTAIQKRDAKLKKIRTSAARYAWIYGRPPRSGECKPLVAADAAPAAELASEVAHAWTPERAAAEAAAAMAAAAGAVAGLGAACREIALAIDRQTVAMVTDGVLMR